MPTDALIQLQPSVTKVATFSGAALILAGGTPRRGLKARIIYSAATNASGSNSVTFSVDVCYDGVPTLWNVDFVAPVINLSTTSQSGEVFIPFEISPTSVANGTQIRLTATFAGAGSTPTITYGGEITLARP
jgi:hypothetical protein